jgi:hypothetical protein
MPEMEPYEVTRRKLASIAGKRKTWWHEMRTATPSSGEKRANPHFSQFCEKCAREPGFGG